MLSTLRRITVLLLLTATLLGLTARPAWCQQESVNPGINKSFQDPDVSQFVERFEREGREVYDKRSEIARAAGIQPGMAVADVGAGTGLFTRLFAERVGKDGRVYAVDIAQKFVDHVQQSCREAGLGNVVGVVCEPDSVELPPASVDRVFICDTYHHFEFPQKTMQSIHRALRPDGEVILIDFKRIEGESSDWILGHVRAGQETFTSEVLSAGFRQVGENKSLLQDNYFLRFKKADATRPGDARKNAQPPRPAPSSSSGGPPSSSGSQRSADAEQPRRVAPLPRVSPAPDDNPTTPAKVELGKQLFFDPRLSGDNTMSCATCHLPERAFADGRARSKGEAGRLLDRNTPSVLNTGLFEALFWDGRAASLEQQALGPITNPAEMNQPLEELEQELGAVPGYVEQFREVFGSEATRDSIARALAAFQRTLVSGPSPLDRFLAGDKQALSPAARRGWELFQGDADCIRCHHGPLLSDSKFYRLGVEYRDAGREAVTGNSQDRYRFRTPSLRNVADTAPYMHDGSMNTLNQVVTFYFRGLPTDAPDDLKIDAEPLFDLSFSDISAVVAFLKSLSGEVPQVEAPQLP